MGAQLTSNWQGSRPVILTNVSIKRLPIKSVHVPFPTLKRRCVIVPSLKSRLQTPKALLPKASEVFKYHTEKRFFLLSINKLKDSKPLFRGRKKGIPRTKNRKTQTKSGALIHKGESYRINAKKSGIYLEIAHAIIDQLEICIAKWKRVLVVRFDLHMKHYTTDNNQIAKFRKNLKRRLERKYLMMEVGHVWVREKKKKTKTQHYHFALFLDGNKVRHSQKILEMVESTWEKINRTGHVPVIRRPYHFINSSASKVDAIYKISYLAKVADKGYRNPRANDFRTSMLSIPFILPV